MKMSNKKARRRRVSSSVLGDEGEGSGGLSIALKRARPKKKRTNLSFTNDLSDGEDAETQSKFSMSRIQSGEEGANGCEHVFFSRDSVAIVVEDEEDDSILRSGKASHTTTLLDIAPRYGKADLASLQKETKTFKSPEAPVILAGDELEQMMANQLQEDDEGNDDDDRLDGEMSAIPTAEQIRVAREKRERMRKNGGGLEDFIPLEENADDSGFIVDKKGAEERDGSDESDDAFEEYRGATIAFGAPAAHRHRPTEEDMGHHAKPSLDDSAVNAWEMDLIRKGSVGAGVANYDDLELSPIVAKKRRKSVFGSVSASNRTMSIEAIARRAKSTVAQCEDQCRTLQIQMIAAGNTSTEGTEELPTAKSELDVASETYDFMQRIREYCWNLASCLNEMIPLIQELHHRVSDTYRNQRDDRNRGAENLISLSDGLREDIASVFANVNEEYSSVPRICSVFDSFRTKHPSWYRDAHIHASLVEIIIPLVRWELLAWPGFLEPWALKLTDMEWFQALAHFGDLEAENTEQVFLSVLEQTLVAKLESLMMSGYTLADEALTVRAVALVDDVSPFFSGGKELISFQNSVCKLLEAQLCAKVQQVELRGEDCLTTADNAAAWLGRLGSLENGGRLRKAIVTFLDQAVVPNLMYWSPDAFLHRFPTAQLKSIDFSGSLFGNEMSKLGKMQ